MIVVDVMRNQDGDVFAKLVYHTEKNYLLMKWMGPCSEEQVKFASLKMLEWQKDHGARNKTRFHVHDTKELEGAWAGLVEWIANYFFPQNYIFGLRYNLSIVSPDIFSKLSSIRLERTNSNRVTTILCETISQAEEIIRKKSNEQSLLG